MKKPHVPMTGTRKFLLFSFIEMLVMCCIILGVVMAYTKSYNDDTVDTIGNIYMEEMSNQLSRHFDTIIGFKMHQLDNCIRAVDPEEVDLADTDALAELRQAAQAREFEHMALCREDGTLYAVQGEQLTLSYPQYFVPSILAGEQKVASAVNAEGDKWLLFGMPAKYRMPDGGESIAILASLPLDYINNSMSLYVDEALTYSHIIQRDGAFVVRNNAPGDNGQWDNFFDRFTAMTLPQDGKSVEEILAELKAIVQSRDKQVYSAMLNAVDGRRHIYCVPLNHTEWYLVTVMPYSTLDKTVTALTTTRSLISLLIMSVLLVNLIIIYYIYFRMTRKQVQSLEAARNEAERANRAKSEFLSNMSHDIRTPMNAIVGMTAIAQANKDNPEQVQDCLKKISLSSKHLLGLINDVLDMSKIESGKMTLHATSLSLKEAIDTVVNIVQPQIKTKEQHFHISVKNIIAEKVWCDGVRLNQVLLNLLSNALKFTPNDGTISLGVSQQPSPKGSEYVHTIFSVRDNGIGMSKEFQAKIFESFMREDNARVNKTEGTGLGMSITKYIVDAMDGSIDIESEQGKGSLFMVTLDLKKVEDDTDSATLPRCRVLVVDNDEEFCHSTKSTLISLGVTADTVCNGQSAAELVKACLAEGKAYDIILIDWRMPGMDGLETARKLNALPDNVADLVLISSADWADIENEAKKAGFAGFMAKPLFRSTLYYGLLPYLNHSDESAEQRKENALRDVNILLAEDNDLNWEIAYELLSEAGLKLERAENGKVCVDMFNASQPGYYKAILMDLRMPVMSGYEATAEIRKSDRADRDIPIIAMTADAFAEDIEKCKAYGMNAHIAKPIDVREVLRHLMMFIKG